MHVPKLRIFRKLKIFLCILENFEISLVYVRLHISSPPLIINPSNLGPLNINSSREVPLIRRSQMARES